jgi:cysteine synthase
MPARFGLSSALDLIGRTPLVHLGRISKGLGADIYGKCEFQNPGLSIKDRIAQFIVEEAERSGQLKPAGTIVEGTAGNTGIGLAVVAAVKGYRLILVIPNTMSKEKIDIVKAYGAELHLVERKPWGDPQHYNAIAERLVREIPGAVWANQFHNLANRRCHYSTTGPEIWEQTEGRVEALFAGMGTSGTLSGAGRFLKEKNPDVKIVATDPHGSVYYNFFKTGEPRAEGSSIIEGVGIGRVPGNYDPEVLDDIVRVDDATAVRMTRRLVREEGMMVGGCSGLVVAGASEWLRRNPSVTNAVGILSDTGRNYLSKLFNEDWLRSQNLPLD